MQGAPRWTDSRLSRRSLLRVSLGLGVTGLLAACQAPAAAPAAPASGVAAASTVAPTQPASPTQVAPTAAKPAGAPTSLADLAVYTGADRQKVLEDGARQEAGVTWYTTLSAPALDLIPQGFEKKYPGIKVEKFRGTPDDVAKRILDETQARRYVYDVMEAGDTTLLTINDQGLTMPFASPLLSAYPADSLWTKGGSKNPSVVVTRMTLCGFGYNTKLVPSSAVPKTFQDLLKPDLKGKMAWAGDNTTTKSIGNMVVHLGEDFVRKLATQNFSRYQVSSSALRDLVASGEVAAAPAAFLNQIEEMKKTGATVDWVPMEPITPSPGGPAVSKFAPHPHAALLFMDFLLGDEVRKILKDLAYSSPADSLPYKIWYPITGATTFTDFDKTYQSWTSLERELFGGA